MENIKRKLQNLETLTENDFFAIREEQKKQIEKLQKTNLKLANVKSNEAISQKLYADYNYRVECFNNAPEMMKESEKRNAERLATSILRKMEWWQ